VDSVEVKTQELSTATKNNGGPTWHHLKTWKPWWNEINVGRKTFELRKDDRDFRIGDYLVLKEYDQNVGLIGQFTGRVLVRRITYILDHKAIPGDWGLLNDYVILSFQNFNE
jgi:hypothetical protein